MSIFPRSEFQISRAAQELHVLHKQPVVPYCVAPWTASSCRRPGAEHSGRPQVGLFSPGPEGQTGLWSGRRGPAALPAITEGRNKTVIPVKIQYMSEDCTYTLVAHISAYISKLRL